ncbi:MAG: hypothetical protein AAB840_01705 [Patescibacteria group bacterium]
MNNNKGGFIKLLISLIIALIILSYFGFDLKKIIEAPLTQQNLNYFYDILKNIWGYIYQGIVYVWNEIIIGIFWNNVNNIWQSGN